jgi:hypothetical protein
MNVESEVKAAKDVLSAIVAGSAERRSTRSEVARVLKVAERPSAETEDSDENGCIGRMTARIELLACKNRKTNEIWLLGEVSESGTLNRS